MKSTLKQETGLQDVFPVAFGTAHLRFVFQVNLSDLAVCLKSAQSAVFPADISTHRCRKTADVNKAFHFRALGSNFIVIVLVIIVYIAPLFLPHCHAVVNIISDTCDRSETGLLCEPAHCDTY